MKFQNNENNVHPHTKVPYTIIGKYLKTTNTGITKFQCNALKPYLGSEEEIVQFDNFLRIELENTAVSLQ